MNVLYFSFISLFCLCCECRGSNALLQFEEAQMAGRQPTSEVIEGAAFEVIDAIETTAEHVVQQDFSTTDDIDLYIDAQTVMQSDLVVLLSKLSDIVNKMPVGDKKNKLQAIIDKYNPLKELEVNNDFIDLCKQTKRALGKG